MKLTLFVLGAIGSQLVISILIAKCMRAGGGPQGTDCLGDPGDSSAAASRLRIGSTGTADDLVAMARRLGADSPLTSRRGANVEATPLSV